MSSIASKERRAVSADTTMTPVALELLVECYDMGTDLLVGQTATRRLAANFLVRAGLVTFLDPQVPQNGLKLTERGRRHVERLLALPISQGPQQGAQNAPGDAAPRFVWAYAEEGHISPGPQTPHEALREMLSNNEYAANQVTALVSSIFLEALTWDQQGRVLERLGWRRAA